MYSTCELRDLTPIKTLLETDPNVCRLVALVKDLGCLRPLIITRSGRKIVDGHKLWLAQKIVHGETHRTECYLVDLTEDLIWVAHRILNEPQHFDFRSTLRPASEELKWRLLSRIRLTVTTNGKKRQDPVTEFIGDLNL